jgi:Na+/H+ antiporter NhaD/arsenite permease-like protein
MEAWIAGVIFLASYALIATERFDRTLAALLGGLLVIVFGVIDQHEAFAAIDFNVIFLLAGMMILAGAVGKTGLFEWLAIRSVKMSRGEPLRLLIILSLITAVVSAFLDNVTTVVLVAPVTLSIATRLKISATPFLISQILASNIGGTATLIGDPPNILIGSAAGLDFGAFMFNLGPVVVLILIAFVVTTRFMFGPSLRVEHEDKQAVLAMNEREAIRDRGLLIRALIVLAFTIVGFLFHKTLGLEAATIALLAATVLLLVGHLDVDQAMHEVEWATLFFFVGLFMLVEAIVHAGIVGAVADGLADATGGNGGLATIALLWFSALASAVVDNIPYTATAIPVVQRLTESGLPAEPMWWALALGACLGGNLTIVGASANVVVANMAARAGHPIKFFTFMRYGAVIVAESLLISTVYLWLRYLR